MRRDPGPIAFTATPVIPGDLEIRIGDEGRIRIGKESVRAGWRSETGEWEWEKIHPCPALRPGTRIAFDGSVVRCGGKRVLYVQPCAGRVGIASTNGAFDLKDAS